MTSGFTGFTQQTLDFLTDLGSNNERPWFQSHKGEYQNFVQTPMRRLVGELAADMAALDPKLDTDPQGGTLSRIYRDTRFSHDKSPYRVNQWIVFKRPLKEWTDRPAFFMEFGPRGYRWGMGSYCPSPASMTLLRRFMTDHLDRLDQAMAAARTAGLTLEGDRYARPRKSPADHPDLVLWHQMKNGYLVQNRPIDQTFLSGDLVDLLRVQFRAAAPLYDLWCEAQTFA